MRHRRATLAALTTLAFLLAVGCETPPRLGASPARPQQEVIRVGAWNVEWLGTPDNRSGPARGRAQTAGDLADYILASGVSVLGLEEIARSNEQGDWTNDTLTAAFELVSQRTGGQWEHHLFPAHSGRNQLCGIAWDTTRVTPIGEPRLMIEREGGGRPDRLWSRPPYGQMFSAGPGQTDFVVVVVHMKSNYGGDFAAQRNEEAQALVAALPAARAALHDDDVMIIGDFNCGSHGEPAVTTFVQAGFVDLNAADVPTHWQWGPLDRMVVPADEPEFPHDRCTVYRDSFCATRQLSADDFKVRFSDHFMIVTEVTVMADDD